MSIDHRMLCGEPLCGTGKPKFRWEWMRYTGQGHFHYYAGLNAACGHAITVDEIVHTEPLTRTYSRLICPACSVAKKAMQPC